MGSSEAHEEFCGSGAIRAIRTMMPMRQTGQRRKSSGMGKIAAWICAADGRRLSTGTSRSSRHRARFCGARGSLPSIPLFRGHFPLENGLIFKPASRATIFSIAPISLYPIPYSGWIPRESSAIPSLLREACG